VDLPGITRCWDSRGTWVNITTNYYGSEDTGTVTWTHSRYMAPPDAPACEAFDPDFRACMERERVRIHAIDEYVGMSMRLQESI